MMSIMLNYCLKARKGKESPNAEREQRIARKNSRKISNGNVK